MKGTIFNVLISLLLYLTLCPQTLGEESHRGRRVVILGASYGIGRSTADLLADQGAHVVYASRKLDLLQEAIKEKPNCHAVVIDASDETSIEEGMIKAASLLGGIDFVLYVPGYFGSDSYGSFERLFDSGDFDSGFEGSIKVHLKGMLLAFRHCRKYLLASKSGCFIALGSIAASMGHPGATLYAIAKAAEEAAVNQLALEYGPLGLRVISVAPGLINTPALDNLGPDRKRFLKALGDTHAMERYAEPIEVAEFIAFLCSERASFITGGPYYVDGGALLRSALGDALRSFTMGGTKQGNEL